jgi:hypothetical protein
LSGKEPINNPAELPPEYDRWNWGAFLLNWIWGIGNSTYIALLVFVPVVNFVVFIMLGLRGNRWAWKNRYWPSLEHFRRTQRNWAKAGFITWAVILIMLIAMAPLIMVLLKQSEAHAMAMRELRGNALVVQTLGEPVEAGFWMTGSVDVKNGSGAATLNIPVSGPKGSGTAYVTATKRFGTWSLDTLVLKIDGGQQIILIDRENKAGSRAETERPLEKMAA